MTFFQSGVGWDGLIWFALFTGLPAMIGFLVGASWLDILKSFAILAAICCLFGFPVANNWDQRLMWAAIYWMVSCLPGIPLILWLMKLAGLR